MKKRSVLLFVILLPVCAAAGYFAYRFFSKNVVVEVESRDTAVVIGYPLRRDLDEVLRYPGTLMSTQTITLVPKISGRVDKIHVSEGDVVTKKQVLVTLEAESVRLQAEQALSAWNAAEAQYNQAERGAREQELENARASFRQAEEDLSAAEKNLERSRRLLNSGTIAKSSFEEVEVGFHSAQTKLDNARRSLNMMEDGASTDELDMARSNADAQKAQYEMAKLQQTYSSLESPGAGVVAKIFADEGNFVGVGAPLLAIIQEDPIYVSIAIPEKHYGRFLQHPERIQVYAAATAYPDSPPFAGRISSVAPVIDVGSRTFIVEATISNQARLLRPGMYVSTELIIATKRNTLVVPSSSVVVRDGIPVVYRIQEGDSLHAVIVPVEIGMKAGGFVEVTGDLFEETPIIVQGNAFLEDGQQVREIIQE